MRVAACQTPEILGDVDAAVGVVLDFASQAPDADLLLFPECFLQGYLVTDQHVREHALEPAEVLDRLGAVRPMLVLGIIERSGDRFHNTALVIAGGRLLGAYRKRFLTAGESVFTAGDSAPVFDCAGVRFGINICYDAQFPEAAAAVAAGGAQVLLLPAQNMMPRDKALWWQDRHNEIRRRRVQETGMWLISADVTGNRDDRLALGPTCAINPAGQVVARVPPGTIGMAVADI
ncbi:carbon-nitrogen hydrolase family protein [Actinoplanes sp. NPDC026619]|uniref:carbon-nitrogen hydrolase family protein n=1 Tax=Actinoplanes sp. NPDC026619 TaxID=3155798 RepID=UPI0033FA8F40